MRVLPLFAALILSLPPIRAAEAASLLVPDSYSTIQSALDQATPGDTVLVRPGRYVENLIMTDGVCLLSTSGPRETILDGDRNGSVIQCVELSPPTQISGFTLERGHAVFGGGLYAFGSAVLFDGNIVRDNSNYSTAYGAGVYTQLCPPEMIVRGNLIVENVGNIGGGICCNGEDRSTIENNTIWGNVAEYASGIISYNFSDITIRGNIIADNDGGKGLWVHSNSAATIECNDVWKNTPVNYHGEDMTGVAGNISLDPLFCDPSDADFRLDGDSPCLPGNHPDGADCDWIGAMEEGCSELNLPGACCFGVDDCVRVTESFCVTFGGTFLGQETHCLDGICPPVGPCCLATGECFVTGIRACEAVGGTFLVGEGNCSPNPCPVSMGGCCLADGSCQVLLGTECATEMGVFGGDGTTCDPPPCDPSSVDLPEPGAGVEFTCGPNPTSGAVTLGLRVGRPGAYTVRMHGPTGRQLQIADLGFLGPGMHEVSIELPTRVGTGVIFLRLLGPEVDLAGRVLVVR